MQISLKQAANSLTRRRFLADIYASFAMGAFVIRGAANLNAAPMAKSMGKITEICIFSKHLQWLDYTGMAETAAEIGFDGIDLTVRPGGHVLPERATDDLPKAVEAVKKAGLTVPMMTTRITDAHDPLTEAILKTASQLGIRYYRLGYYKYEEGKSIPARLAEIKPMLQDLAAVNKELNICGDYQNHAGENRVGAAIWDLWELMKDLDSQWLGVQFDIRHAMVEGGTSWPTDYRLISPKVHTIVAKDFKWQKTAVGWHIENCPLGQGMVEFERYFKMVQDTGFAGPLTIHFEYPLGGANKGARKLTIPEADVVKAMKQDLKQVKAWLREIDFY